MLTADGPRVLEYNCRFGDPETQSLLPRLDGDLLDALAACTAGSLAGVSLPASEQAAVTVVLAARDYPERGDIGTPIEGIAAAEAAGALVFHAGTAVRDGQARHERRQDPQRDRARRLARRRACCRLRRRFAHRFRGREIPPGHRPCLKPSSGSSSARSRTASACRAPSTCSKGRRRLRVRRALRASHARRGRRVRAHRARARPARADLRGGPLGGAARRRRRAHRSAGDRRAAQVEPQRARRPRRAARDHADAARRSGRRGRSRQRAQRGRARAAHPATPSATRRRGCSSAPRARRARSRRRGSRARARAILCASRGFMPRLRDVCVVITPANFSGR